MCGYVMKMRGELVSLLAVITVFSFADGFRESAVSLNIPSNVAMKSAGWKKIQNWQAPIESGHVITGTKLTGTSRSDVYIPYSGLYAVFVTVSLSGADINSRFMVSIVINGKVNNTHSMVAGSKGGPLGPKSITVQGVLYLQYGDFISVYVYSESDSDWTITGQSVTTFSVQFIETLGEVPGFSAVLEKAKSVQTTGWRNIREWRTGNIPGLFSSMTGFSRHVGEFVAISEGIYLAAANIRIQTNVTGYFELGFAMDSAMNGTVVKRMSSNEFTLSISNSFHLRKGQRVDLRMKAMAAPFTLMADSSFSAVFLSSYTSTTPGFSTIFEKDVQGTGGGWTRISLESPNGTTFGQFETDKKYLSDGKYYPPIDGVYIITGTIRMVADSLIGGSIFTRAISGTSLSGNILGLYSRVTKTDLGQEVTFTTSGVMQLLGSQLLLSFYIYMQNAGNYKILAGSRISVTKVQPRYPAFHATLEAELPQTSNNAWITVTTWNVDKAKGSFSETSSLSSSTGRYKAEISGIYHVSSNMIFSGQASFISLLISINDGQSKRNTLFSTKGDPAGKDSLSVSGSLRLTKGDTISVLVKAAASSWSVGVKSSFSVAFLGLPFSVPGFSAVLASTLTYTADGWHQVKGLLAVASSGSLFSYGGGLDLTECKYTVPLTGLYIISANLKLKRAATIGSEFTVNVAVDESPSKQYLNGLNDFVKRTVSLGTQDFYSLNIAGVLKLTAKQNVTLWVKSTGAGSWDISEDSGFSVAFLHADNDFHASGFQAALNPLISQSVVGATKYKLIRYWVTTRSETAKGLFNLDKYQDLGASSGIVTIREPGFYFVSAAITLKDAIGKFEIGVHLDSQIAALYSLVDASKLDRYTMKAFGILKIGAAQTLSIRVQASAKKNWEQDIFYCGLSFVKIAPFLMPPALSTGMLPQQSIDFEKGNWSRIQSWTSAKTPVQKLTGSKFSKTTGVFTAESDGVYIVSAYLMTETTSTSATVALKIALNPDTTMEYTPVINNGLSTVNSHCNKSCVLHVNGVLNLKQSDEIAVYVQSNDASSLLIQNSSTFSVVLVSESLPLPNGLLAQLSTQEYIAVKGNKQITGWQLSPASGNFFGSTGSMDSFYVTSTGIYFVSINIKFRNLQGLAKAFTSLVNIPAITAVHRENSGNQFVLSVSGAMKIASGSYYTVTVHSETDSDYLVLPDSIKTAVYLGPVSKMIGFTAVQSETKTIAVTPNTNTYLHGWSISGKAWLFEAGTGFTDRKSFIAPQSGIYYLSCHIIISTTTTVNASSVLLSLGVQRDGFVRKEDGLQTNTILSGVVSTTVVLAGSVYLEKWSQVKLVMQASHSVSITINIDSTFSIVKLSKDLSLNRCIDNGPNIVGHLSPDVLRTSFKKVVGWKCEATGPSVTYSWMKNYVAIPGQSLTTLNINNAQVADTGEYVCTASYDGVRVSSNIAMLTVFDPLPIFLNPAEQYSFNATENGSEILGLLRVSVRARSLGSAYAQMSFVIISGNMNNTFSLSTVKSDNGFILMRNEQLDRENISSYSITIQATNLEEYSVATQQINITVTDLNDNAPIFTQKKYTTAIYENTTIGSTIIRLLATDRDIGENARIKYWFIPSSAKTVFAINPDTGYVTLEGAIDREKRDLYVIFVKAYDPVFSAYSELSIQILDVNEHAPVFKPVKYSVNVSETLLPGSSLLTVRASDNDTGRNAELTYKIISGDPGGIFRITKYGTIQNQLKLDYEKNTSYTLNVSVHDNGQTPMYSNLTAEVSISITDANDNSPVFGKESYAVDVFENATIGDHVLTVLATDMDAAGQPESTITYDLKLTGDMIGMFILNSSTGVIKLNASLDYEKTTSYIFTVIACDAGTPSLKDKAQVTVNVKDVNDNKPKFSASNFVVNVTESSQINRVVFKVSASDEDSGLNSVLRYSLVSGNTGNTFTIDPITGSIIAMKSLDRERDAHYNLVIICKDQGNPQMTSSTSLEVQINVLDENDNAPIFNMNSYVANVPENLTIGATILHINVSDPDAGMNGMIDLRIIEASAREMFEYDPVTSALKLKRPLDYESVSQYHFTVIARDMGVPVLEKSAVVDIVVQNVNDNSPKFDFAVYNSQIPEMVFENFTVYRMIATDLDAGPGGKLTYEIVSGNTNGQFKIGAYTGIVKTAKNLNTTHITSFALEIVAKDNFKPPALSNRTRLNVHVTKTVSILLNGIKAGTTSLEGTVDITGFDSLNIEKFQILMQEYRPNDVNFNMVTGLAPLSWYAVNVRKTPALDEMRRFIALSVPTVTAVKRRRRAAVTNGKISVVIGTAKNCESNADVEICNGPLKSNKQYRLQVRGYSVDNKFPRDSYFSSPIQLGEPAATVAKLSDFATTDGTIGLAVAFAVSTILTIILLGCFVKYKRRHEIIYVDHINKQPDLNLSKKYSEDPSRTALKSGFGPLSDISVWPQMSMAEVSHMFQRSQGMPTENYAKLPRSPGDSGINHGYEVDEEDSWRMSDENDESWEDLRRLNGRPHVRVRQASHQDIDLRLPKEIISPSTDNNGSTSSLETNAEAYKPPRLSESLRGIFRREDSREGTTDVKGEVEMSIISEENENELETNLGAEIETNLGPDAEQSSSDDDNIEPSRLY